MRSEIFGQAQNRLTQALRSNANDLGPLLNNPTSEYYSQRIEKLRQLDKHLADVFLAIAFVLQRDCPRAEQVIVKSLDFKMLSQGKQALEKLSRHLCKHCNPPYGVVSAIGSHVSGTLRTTIHGWRPVHSLCLCVT